MNTWTVLKSFLKINYLIDLNFIAVWKINVLKKDHLHANNVWNMFKINSVGDYHNLYLKPDVLLLANFFQKFISTCNV